MADRIPNPEQGPHLESTNRHIGIVRGVRPLRFSISASPPQLD